MHTTTHYFPLYHTHTHTQSQFARFSDNIYFDIFFWIGMQIETKQNMESKENPHIHSILSQPALPHMTKEYLSLSSCLQRDINWVSLQ
jgi:hypothetical protein